MLCNAETLLPRRADMFIDNIYAHHWHAIPRPQPALHLSCLKVSKAAKQCPSSFSIWGKIYTIVSRGDVRACQMLCRIEMIECSIDMAGCREMIYGFISPMHDIGDFAHQTPEISSGRDATTRRVLMPLESFIYVARHGHGRRSPRMMMCITRRALLDFARLVAVDKLCHGEEKYRWHTLPYFTARMPKPTARATSLPVLVEPMSDTMTDRGFSSWLSWRCARNTSTFIYYRSIILRAKNTHTDEHLPMMPLRERAGHTSLGQSLSEMINIAPQTPSSRVTTRTNTTRKIGIFSLLPVSKVVAVTLSFASGTPLIYKNAPFEISNSP